MKEEIPKEEISKAVYTNVVADSITTTNVSKKIGEGSAYFSGVPSQRLKCSVQNLNFGMKDFTIEFWVYPETQTMAYPVLCGDDSNVNLVFFLADSASSGNISLQVNGRIINTGKKYKPNIWTHYALVRKDGVFTIYENGINIGETSSYITTNVNISSLSIGGNSSTSNTAYKGYIDDFVIYDYSKYTQEFTVTNKPIL
ncbi:hypothetical protein D3C72_1453850 [compost metagenome]